MSTLVEVIKIKQNAISIASTCIPKNLFLQSFSTALNIVLNVGQLTKLLDKSSFFLKKGGGGTYNRK